MFQGVSKSKGFEQEYKLVRTIEGTSWSIWYKKGRYGWYQVVLKSDDDEKLKRSIYRPLESLYAQRFRTPRDMWRDYGRLNPLYRPTGCFFASEVITDVVDVDTWVQLVLALFKVAEHYVEREIEEDESEGGVL